VAPMRRPYASEDRAARRGASTLGSRPLEEARSIMTVIAAVLLVALLALVVLLVRAGRWTGTWAGSGMETSPRKFPGGPTRDTPHSIGF
jgi:hypothetical protein